MMWAAKVELRLKQEAGTEEKNLARLWEKVLGSSLAAITLGIKCNETDPFICDISQHPAIIQG